MLISFFNTVLLSKERLLWTSACFLEGFFEMLGWSRWELHRSGSFGWFSLERCRLCRLTGRWLRLRLHRPWWRGRCQFWGEVGLRWVFHWCVSSRFERLCRLVCFFWIDRRLLRLRSCLSKFQRILEHLYIYPERAWGWLRFFFILLFLPLKYHSY